MKRRVRRFFTECSTENTENRNFVPATSLQSKGNPTRGCGSSLGINGFYLHFNDQRRWECRSFLSGESWNVLGRELRRRGVPGSCSCSQVRWRRDGLREERRGENTWGDRGRRAWPHGHRGFWRYHSSQTPTDAELSASEAATSCPLPLQAGPWWRQTQTSEAHLTFIKRDQVCGAARELLRAGQAQSLSHMHGIPLHSYSVKPRRLGQKFIPRADKVFS